MGRELEIETDRDPIFDNKMEKPQRALQMQDWKSFKRFFQEDNRALLEPVDLAGNTAIHIAAVQNKPHLLREFLQMLSPTDQWHVLRRKNVQKSTVLDKTNLSVEIAEIVLKGDKELPQPPENEMDPKELEEKDVPLLELRNLMGETPIYRAALDGNLDLLKYLSKNAVDIKKHFHRDSDRISILHAAVVAQHFDVALWLLNLDDSLAYEKDDNGYTCLQLLSIMPSVFRSGNQFGIAKQPIYNYLLPDYRYYDDEDVDDVSTILPGRDIEKGENNIKKHISVLSRVNLAIWKRLANEWHEVKRFLMTKHKNYLSEQLVDVLVRKDNSWQKSFVQKQKSPTISPRFLSFNVSSKSNDEKQCTKQTTLSNSDYTPLLLAASSGIVEIVERFIQVHPQAIYHVSEDELNILHVAVMHRQRKIYQIVKETGAWRSLRYRLSANGNNLLHQVGSIRFYKEQHEAGIAYQLQEELRWFDRVEKILPTYLIIHHNDDDMTAEELFKKEHSDMLDKAKEWIQKTAESCSAVSVLVATVVFAAAYTVPGGYDQNGLPIFLGTPVFLFFTIMDVVALASSLFSVVLFLSILTSSFGMKDFQRSLPRKLSLGFGFLFFSLITTMLAFSASVLLIIKLEKEKWTSTLVYSAAFFPVAVFGLFQFPFYVAVIDLLKATRKKLAKMLPSSFKRSSKLVKGKYRKF